MKHLLGLMLIFWAFNAVVVAEEAATLEHHTLKIKLGKKFLDCELTIPDKGLNLPLVIWSPGGDATKAYLTGYRNFADTLADTGCAVLSVAFNGDTAANRAKNFNLLASKIEKITTKLWKRIDRTKIIYGGHSRGGVAAFAAAANNDQIVGVIGYNASHPLALQNEKFPEIKSVTTNVLLLVGDQMAQGQYIDRNAADAFMKLIHGPVVFAQFKKLSHNLSPMATYNKLNTTTASWLKQIGFVDGKPKDLKILGESLKKNPSVMKSEIRIPEIKKTEK